MDSPVSHRPFAGVILAVLVATAAFVLAPAAFAAPGGWVAPVSGPLVVRRPFVAPTSPWGPGHRGVDLGAPPGAVVRAAGGGRVGYAGPLAGRGVVTVVHGVLRTTYEPVDPLVTAGAVVAAGDALGFLVTGHAGPARPREALLHWGLLRGTTYLDPMTLLRHRPSRLVPVPPARPAGTDAARAALLDPTLVQPPFGPPAGAQAGVAVPGEVRDALPGGGRGGVSGDGRGGVAGNGRGGRPGSRAPARGAASATAVAVVAAFAAAGVLSRAGPRASRGAGARPSCASGRCGSRSRPTPGRSPPG